MERTHTGAPLLLCTSLYPLIAPLPIPVAQHLLLRMYRVKQGEDAVLNDQLLEAVITARAKVLPSIAAALKSIKKGDDQEGHSYPYGIPTSWVRQNLPDMSPAQQKVVSQTLSYWHTKGLLWRLTERWLHPDAVASLCIARMVDNGERNFLPTDMSPDNHQWYCFVRRSPSEEVEHIGVHQIESLPPATLCWTPWVGASWDPKWTCIYHDDTTPIGAARWAGCDSHHGQCSYVLEHTQAQQWDSTIVSWQEFQNPDICHTQLVLTLKRRALQMLSQPEYDLRAAFRRHHTPC